MLQIICVSVSAMDQQWPYYSISTLKPTDRPHGPSLWTVVPQIIFNFIFSTFRKIFFSNNHFINLSFQERLLEREAFLLGDNETANAEQRKREKSKKLKDEMNRINIFMKALNERNKQEERMLDQQVTFFNYTITQYYKILKKNLKWSSQIIL